MKRMLILFFILTSCFVHKAQNSPQLDSIKDSIIYRYDTCYSEIDDSVFLYIDIDKLPKFNVKGYKSAISYLLKNINYPAEADVAGKIVVSFVITSDGNVKDVVIEKSLYYECDNEVKRVLYSMPKWLAGVKNGKNVNTRLFLSVPFYVE